MVGATVAGVMAAEIAAAGVTAAGVMACERGHGSRVMPAGVTAAAVTAAGRQSGLGTWFFRKKQGPRPLSWIAGMHKYLLFSDGSV